MKIINLLLQPSSQLCDVSADVWEGGGSVSSYIYCDSAYWRATVMRVFLRLFVSSSVGPSNAGLCRNDCSYRRTSFAVYVAVILAQTMGVIKHG